MSIRYLPFIAISLILASCNNNILTNNTTLSDTTIDTSYVDTIASPKYDSEWFNKDLYSSSDYYILESVDVFKTRFDSIAKLNRWGIKLPKGTLTKYDSYKTMTIYLSREAKIDLKIDKSERVLKILLFANGYGDDFDESLINIMKCIILSTLNSSCDTGYAELIIHQTGSLNNNLWMGPGILMKHGHRYEIHSYEDKYYFGVSH